MTTETNPHVDTDNAILRHVALYRITIREAVQRILPKTKDAGNALAALVKSGHLKNSYNKSPLSLPGKRKYFILGPEARSAVNVTKERYNPPKAQALSQHLAILWFCMMGKERYHRLEHAELRELLGDATPRHNAHHCIGSDKLGPVVYRLYVARSDVNETLRRATELFETSMKQEKVRDWISTGDYGFAILAATEQLQRDIEDALTKRQDRKAPLSRQARFVVGHGPSPQTLGSALQALKKKSNQG